MKIIYFDTETTGVKDSEICQLSYIIDNRIEIYGKNYFFKVKDMNPYAQMVHGFSLEMLNNLSGGNEFKDYIDEIDKDFSDATLLVAHNASFDISMMRKEYRRLKREFNVKDYLCTMKYMAPIMKLMKVNGSGFKYPSLSEFVSYYIQDTSIINETVKDLFGIKTCYHDARYDVTSMYLALYYAREGKKILKEKVCSSD